jgi:hypothetical protein
MMFCDVDGVVINRDSWSRVRVFFLGNLQKCMQTVLVDENQKPLSLGHSVMLFTVHCSSFWMNSKVGVSRKNCPVIGVTGHGHWISCS